MIAAQSFSQSKRQSDSLTAYCDDADWKDYLHDRSQSVPKADAWREKNRLAQKAFRQRQKVCPTALAHTVHPMPAPYIQHQDTRALIL